MNDRDTDKILFTKRLYEKPQLKQVELKTEDILGVGCVDSTLDPGVAGGLCGPGLACNTD